MRGNPGNLRVAARAKHEAAVLRAEKGLKAVLRAQAPVTFEGVAAAAGVSKDFLYRTPELRTRITALREQQTPAKNAVAGRNGELTEIDTSSIIRTLTAKLASERASYRQELTELNQALAAAHGQILTLKRRFPNTEPSSGRHELGPTTEPNR